MSRKTVWAVTALLVIVGCGRARDAGSSPAAGSGGSSAAGGAAGSQAGSNAAGKGGSTAGKGAGGFGGNGANQVQPREVDGGVCCLPDVQPGCCMSYGGFAPDPSQCFSACDGMPSATEAWTLGKDAHGCVAWAEPEDWTDCCGCGEPKGPTTRTCDPEGTWQIEYEPNHSVCSQGRSAESISIAAGDGGTLEVDFANRGLVMGNCGGNSGSRYEASVTRSEDGCEVKAVSNQRWCSYNELRCNELQITLYIRGDAAIVQGWTARCWCGSSGPNGARVELRGFATRVRP